MTTSPSDIEEISIPIARWSSSHDVFLVSRGTRVTEPLYNQAYVYERLTYKLIGTVRFSNNKWTYYRRPTVDEILELRDLLLVGKIDIVFKL